MPATESPETGGIGVYHYAPAFFVKYFKAVWPAIWPCTKIPPDLTAPERGARGAYRGQPIVHISVVQAGAPPVGLYGSSPVHAWRRMVFVCIAGESTKYRGELERIGLWDPEDPDDPPPEIVAAGVCDQVRSNVMIAAHGHAPKPFRGVIRDVQILGEPGRVDLADEPRPRFQTTIDVLLREHHSRSRSRRQVKK